MLKFIYKSFVKLNYKIKKIVKFGFEFSLLIAVLSELILFTYIFLLKIPNLYYLGIGLFKLSLIYFVTFLCFGYSFNKILTEF